MDISEDIKKYNIYLDPRGSSILVKNNAYYTSTGNLNLVVTAVTWNDWFVPIFLTKTSKVIEYVDVQKDNKIDVIERQNINPYFIEFGFFDTIKRNKVNIGEDLTTNMIQFIRENKSDVSGFTDFQIVEWFNREGKNLLPWEESGNTTTIDDIDKSQLTWDDIISKANFYNIDINK